MDLMSPTIDKLAQALCSAQLRLELAHRRSKNPFYHSSYAAFEDIWGACRIPLNENGLSVAQMTHASDKGLCLVTTLMHTSGQWIRGEYLLNPLKNDPQSLGSALSYAKRYALAAMVGVVSSDEDDDGEKSMNRNKGVNNGHPPAPRSTEGRTNHPPQASGAASTHVSEPGWQDDTFPDFDSLPAQGSQNFTPQAKTQNQGADASSKGRNYTPPDPSRVINSGKMKGKTLIEALATDGVVDQYGQVFSYLKWLDGKFRDPVLLKDFERKSPDLVAYWQLGCHEGAL